MALTKETTPLPESNWQFRRIAGGYQTASGDLGITITADELDRKAGELTAMLCVRSTMVGLRTVDGDVLKVGKLNFYAPRSRSEWANELSKRCPGEAQSLDWAGYLERFVHQVITAERTGDPALVLRDVEDLPDTNRYLVPGLISGEEATIWFGDGGSMKSYLALASATTIASGTPLIGIKPTRRANVGYIDWEYSPHAHRRRLGRLMPTNAPDNLYYIRCDRPLVHEVNRIQRLVNLHRLGFLVFDSVVYGCDGPAEQSDTAARYFQALRQIGVPSLLIAHVTKSEDGDKKPFGTTFWHNSARLTWYLKKSADNGEQTAIGMFNRKNNDDRELSPLGFTFTFSNASNQTSIRPSRVDEDPVLAEKMPVRERIMAVVSRHPETMAEIASVTGIELNTVVQTVRRGEGKTFVRLVGDDGVSRIGLLGKAPQPVS